MNVLSLFDGMSCGQIALERAGIKVDNYFASEIDKYAIQVTMANYPKTIQLGDVTKVHAKDLPKIDLLIGGSPCQGFSFAGKGLNFEDERSKLFFEYVRILNECKPQYFLLENVQMKYEHELVISRYVGCNPVVINSSLVSAQNRVRNYWTNINSKPVGMFGDMEADIKQPKDKGILLKDILESGVDLKYYLKENHLKWWNENKEFQLQKQYSALNPEKGITLTARSYQSWNGTYLEDNLISIKLGRSTEFERNNSSGKAYAVDTQGKDGFMLNNKIRRLTEVECERLQTVPDNYTNHVSSTQRYKMLGNGWTVDVVAHILKFINK